MALTNSRRNRLFSASNSETGRLAGVASLSLSIPALPRRTQFVLSYGLALVLMFIGVKMLLIDFFKIPVFLALGVVVALIAARIAASLVWRPKPTG